MLIKAASFVLVIFVTAAVGTPSFAQSSTREWVSKDSKKKAVRRYENAAPAAAAAEEKPRERREERGPINSDNSGGPQHHIDVDNSGAQRHED
jgi:hypothetical protein